MNMLKENSCMLVGFVDLKEICSVKGIAEPKKIKTVFPVLFIKNPTVDPKKTLTTLFQNFVRDNIIAVIGDDAISVETRVSDAPIVSYEEFLAKPSNVDSRFFKPEKDGYKKVVLRGFCVDKGWITLYDKRMGVYGEWYGTKKISNRY